MFWGNEREIEFLIFKTMHMVVIRFISVKYLHGMILFVDIFIYNIERVKDTYYLNKYKKKFFKV